MADITSLNSQPLEAASLIDTLVTGLTPPVTMAMLDGVLTETLAMAMNNAVCRQQAGSQIASAAVSAACARIAGTARPAPLPPSIPPLPPEPPHA